MVEEGSDPLPTGIDGSLFGLSEQGFELGEDLLDRVQVGRVRRQEEELGASAADRSTNGDALMAAQVVHDDDVARAERRHQELLDISEEGLAVDGAVEHARCIDPIMAERGEKGKGSPVPVRHLRAKSLAAPGATMRAGHVRLRPGFVDEDQAFRIEAVLVFAPLNSPPGNRRSILLDGEHGFF